MFRSLAVIWIAAALAATGCVVQRTYRSADIDTSGQLRIVTSNGREIIPRKDSDQVAFDQAAISADGRTVGWVGLYPNCCTTDPIPLKLVVLDEGTERTFVGDGRPVWRWSFSADGKQVAFKQAPVHGEAGQHFELREIRTGRLLGSFDTDFDTAQGAPVWARALRLPP